MTDDVEGLIERLEKATGPDRELDHALDAVSPAYTGRLAYYTRSIDAALALTERLLPGSWWLMAKGRVRAGEPLYALQLFSEGHNPFTSLPIAEAEHETLCCAILLATLRAKRSSP